MPKLILSAAMIGAILGVSATTIEAAQFKGKTPPKGKGGASESAKPQQQNLAKLKSDLEAIYKNSAVTPQQKQAVAQDLQKILATANKPSQASVQALANDLATILADKKITPTEALRLTQSVSAVLSSANISQQDAQKVAADVKTLLKATNATQAQAQVIVQDVQAIVKTAQQNAASGGQKKAKKIR